MTDMRVLIKIPSRSRPDALRNVMLAYERLSSGNPRTGFLISLDSDDHTMGPFVNPTKMPCSIVYGVSTSKIDAINRDVNLPDWSVLVVGSDDCQIMTPNWDDIIREEFTKHFPDTDGVLWARDGFNTRIVTQPIIGRAWYDRYGFVFDPRFKSLYVDDLLTLQARQAGKLKQTDRILFRHQHYRNRLRVRDALDKKNESFMRIDYELFRDVVRGMK